MTMPLNQTLLARASAKLGPQLSLAIGLLVLVVLFALVMTVISMMTMML